MQIEQYFLANVSSLAAVCGKTSASYRCQNNFIAFYKVCVDIKYIMTLVYLGFVQAYRSTLNHTVYNKRAGDTSVPQLKLRC